jgi:hypothetical protein
MELLQSPGFEAAAGWLTGNKGLSAPGRAGGPAEDRLWRKHLLLTEKGKDRKLGCNRTGHREAAGQRASPFYQEGGLERRGAVMGILESKDRQEE